jgi:hypothetical protein
VISSSYLEQYPHIGNCLLHAFFRDLQLLHTCCANTGGGGVGVGGGVVVVTSVADIIANRPRIDDQSRNMMIL